MLNVNVANGEIVHNEGQCSRVCTKIQGITFYLTYYILRLAVRDVVLGVQWLETLKPIVWDFSKLYMKFPWEGTMLGLMGLRLKNTTFEDGRKMVLDSVNKRVEGFYYN